MNPLAMLATTRPADVALANSDAQNSSWNLDSLDDSWHDLSSSSHSHHSHSLNASRSSFSSPHLSPRTSRRKRTSRASDVLRRNLALLDASSSSSLLGNLPADFLDDDIDHQAERRTWEQHAMARDELPVIVVQSCQRNGGSNGGEKKHTGNSSSSCRRTSSHRSGSGRASRRGPSMPKAHLELQIPNL